MKFERDYFVHYYDIDLRKKLQITSLLRYFEDIAILQSENNKIGLDFYHKNNVAWVLYKWKVDIKKYPCFNETIKVITQPRAFLRFYAYRTFEARNYKDEILADAVSLWFFVDTISRKPAKITEEIIKGYNVPPADAKAFEIEDMKAPEKEDFVKSFRVRLGDIDTNNHVNNISYVEWALEVVPEDIFQEYSLKGLKTVYKKEAVYGNNISSSVEIEREDDRIICRHKIYDEDNDLCLLETIWQKGEI